MISKTFNRYIWLLNEFLQKGSLIFPEISIAWSKSDLGDGNVLPLRTFHQHRKAIEELFGVKIVCDKYNGYSYSIEDLGVLRNDRTRQWLLNSFSISNMITAGHNMKGRIIFEDIPHGTEYLQTVIEAMQESKELMVDYQAFDKGRKTYHIQPYAMKVFGRRWYILGFLKEDNALRSIALDRVIDMEKTKESFELPKDFNAEKYYANYVGIYVNDKLTPQKVRIRVFGDQIEYLRTLPLHKSQEEVAAKLHEYSEFQYRLCITPEFISQILSMGEKVVVLEPQSLRDEIKLKLTECLIKY